MTICSPSCPRGIHGAAAAAAGGRVSAAWAWVWAASSRCCVYRGTIWKRKGHVTIRVPPVRNPECIPISEASCDILAIVTTCMSSASCHSRIPVCKKQLVTSQRILIQAIRNQHRNSFSNQCHFCFPLLKLMRYT